MRFVSQFSQALKPSSLRGYVGVLGDLEIEEELKNENRRRRKMANVRKSSRRVVKRSGK